MKHFRFMALSIFIMAYARVSANYLIIDGIKYELSESEAEVKTLTNFTYSGDIVIPASVTYNEKTYSVTRIGSNAFDGSFSSGYKDITSITIPSSVTSIGTGAFRRCPITSFTIPGSVKNIGESAFQECSGLTSITIPSSVTSIGLFAFSGCNSIETVTVEDGNTVYDSRNGCNAIIETATNALTKGFKNTTVPSSVTSIDKYAFSQCSSLTSIIIPNSVTSIGERAFSGCTSLSSVTIGNSVTSIGDYVFVGCSGLTSIDIPNNVTSIGCSAFGNSGLTSVTIPSGVTNIENLAFQGCSALTSVTIPPNVTNIGYGILYNCKALKNLVVNCPTLPDLFYNYTSYSFPEALESVDFGEDVQEINCLWSTTLDLQTRFSFNDVKQVVLMKYKDMCNPISHSHQLYIKGTEIQSLIIPSDVTSIENSVLFGCRSLTSVTIPSSVTTIGNYAFGNCTSLSSVTIGSSVTSIGNRAFRGCTGLTDIYCYAENVPSTESSAFDNSSIASATLHVPAGSVEAYRTTAPWSSFGTAVPIDGLEICATPTISYVNGKLKFSSETEGVRFISAITDDDIKTYDTEEIDLGVTYTISVYATKEDYYDSEVATGTLCWIDQQPSTEGIIAEDAVTEVKALPVLIQSNGGTITVQGANEGTEIMVYSVNGMKQGSAIATNGFATINTSLQSGSTAIVKIGEKSIKVLVK